ncbi:hypothetical protein B0H11DRAFT_2053966 [Mycena galericulata]|nr:hypothetical protein B0H11DRAFT_2053966 [Mycena galericulata]
MAKNSKRKREESSEEEEEEEEEGEQESFVVEVITKARVLENASDDPHNSWWAGYGSDDDTWEPASNLSACQRLLASFWEEVGADDKDYPVGHVVKASEKWIKMERKRFKAEFAKGKDEARKQKERADRKKEAKLTAKKEAKKRKQSLSAAPSRSASISSVPVSSSHKSVSSYPAPLPTAAKKKQKIFLSDSESDSDDDKPLANLKKRKMSPKAVDGKQAKVRKTDSQDKDTSSASVASTPKLKASEENNKGKSAPPSRPASRPPTPPLPLPSLFSPSPTPPTSPEITLSSLNPKPLATTAKPPAKPQVPGTAASTASAPAPPKRLSISANTEKSAPSVAPKPTPLPLPKPSAPLPTRQRTTSSNVGAPASSSRSFGSKTSTPVIPATGKPATPTIPAAKPASKPPTPVIPPAAKPASATNAPTIPPSAIPAHMQRKASASGSGLSTKQRLAQGALDLAPTNKEVAARKSGLSGLSFKKNSSSSAFSGSGPSGSGASTSRIRKLPLPPRPSIDPLFDAPEAEADQVSFELVDSPVNTHDEEDRDIIPPTSTLSRRTSQASQASLSAQVDDFLKDIIPTNPTAPPTVTADKQAGPPPRPLGSKKMPPKIHKKWKWTGKLLMDVGDKTDHLCDVVLNELVPPAFEGLRISAVMESVQSVHLLSFHDLVDMSEFLKNSVRMNSQQLARLGPSTDKDAASLKILARYMTKKNLVSLVPAFLDETLVGHLLLFPPSLRILVTVLSVPNELDSNSTLIAALIPWQTYPEESRRPFGILPSSTKSRIPSEMDWRKTMVKSKYQLALRILKFPPPLHEWMSKANRPYCIWPAEAPGGRKGTWDRETEYLLTILKQCGATRVSLKTDFRSIFVHVGALKAIHKMPLLVERRSQTCSIRFYTYGTHEIVHPEYWGVREIYPFGGVVTFTPSALYEDPWGVINTMKVIDKHPLWMCYILPSVLAMATKQSSPGEDPLAAFDTGVYIFELLLRAIDDGEVSLLQSPPLGRNPSSESDKTEEWLRDHWTNRPLGQRRILEYCMNAFSTKYANVPETEWATAVQAEISEDLDLMQRQPIIMEHYRRYVVIKAESDDGPKVGKHGFEWVTNSKFSFNDNFLGEPQKTVE